MITALQKKSAQAIVNIFETGSVLGDYGNVTIMPGDTGHLTFGRSQTTLSSGNLFTLLQMYCENAGARFAAKLNLYLERCENKDLSLDNDLKLHNILRASADDPVMRDTQDHFFEQVYWKSAERSAGRTGISTPLGVAVVYDSTIHGSWVMMRDRTIRQAGSLEKLGERSWIEAYVRTRRDWLASNANPKLRPTVYRMDAFERLIEQGYWGLPLPLVVRGNEISAATLQGVPPGCYDGPQPGSRLVSLQSPLQRGLDVRLIQLGLSDRGMNVKADGIFGQTSSGLVKAFQQAEGLPATGVADALLIGKLVS